MGFVGKYSVCTAGVLLTVKCQGLAEVIRCTSGFQQSCLSKTAGRRVKWMIILLGL